MTPPQISAVRRLQFAAGHRVFKHESKCANMHGHNYVLFAHAVAENGLDSVGRVIDFGVLKEKLGGWIEINWDHAFLVYEEDGAVLAALRSIGGRRFACRFNPTAENMALYLLNDVCPRLFGQSGVRVLKVVLWETENCFAEAAL